VSVEPEAAWEVVERAFGPRFLRKREDGARESRMDRKRRVLERVRGSNAAAVEVAINLGRVSMNFNAPFTRLVYPQAKVTLLVTPFYFGK
jgi:hypothetical protein